MGGGKIEDSHKNRDFYVLTRNIKIQFIRGRICINSNPSYDPQTLISESVPKEQQR